MSAQAIGSPNSAAEYTIPVIGGHSGHTIIPLLSQSQPALPASLFEDKAKLEALVKRIQFGGDEVVEAKAGGGSATLSMAYAGYKFAQQVIAAAFEGKKGVVAPSYVYVEESKDILASIGKDLAFFSVPVELGVRHLHLVFFCSPAVLEAVKLTRSLRLRHSPTALRSSTRSATSRLTRRSSSPPALPSCPDRSPRVSSSSSNPSFDSLLLATPPLRSRRSPRPRCDLGSPKNSLLFSTSFFSPSLCLQRRPLCSILNEQFPSVHSSPSLLQYKNGRFTSSQWT